MKKCLLWMLLIVLPLTCFAEDGISIFPVSGATYKGYVMIVDDPSRVFVGVTSPSFSSSGMDIDKLVLKYGAVGGVNASGFEDINGKGNGSSPYGTVISEGQFLRADSSKEIAAFDQDNVLHVGAFTRQDAEELNLRDGAGWGPALILNGEPADRETINTGLNPRTAIGQRPDGAVIFVVLDGRHPSALGATLDDLVEILLRYGAVNACNMDGGLSSILYYEGERKSDVTTLDRSRKIPTAFLIRAAETETEPPEDETCFIYAPESFEVTLNGETLIAPDTVQSPDNARLPKGVPAENTRVYTVSAKDEDKIRAFDENGREAVFTRYDGVLTAVNDALDMPDELRTLSSQTLEAIAQYAAGIRDVGVTRSYVEKDSAAAQYLYEYSRWKSTKASRGKYSAFECINYIRTDEHTFQCDVQADYLCTYFSRDDTPYRLNYTFFFSDRSGKWMLYDFITR